MRFSFPTVPDIDNEPLRQELEALLERKSRMPGALGDVGALAIQLGLVQDRMVPRLQEPQLLVFAADHGLAAQGVSVHSSGATRLALVDCLQGGSAVAVLARQHGLQLSVVDCGLEHPLDALAAHPGLIECRVGPGTCDASLQPAMSLAQCQEAIAKGAAVVQGLPGNVLLLGDAGVGNSSAAALLLARLAGIDIADCAGTGSGLDNVGLDHKIKVLSMVLRRHAYAAGPMAALTAMGGFEIAAMVGAVLQAAHERRIVVVDGFVSSAAVLVAHGLAPAVMDCCVFAHCAGERGHRLMLDHMGASPLLDLGLRMGEGTGAALAWPLLQSACHLMAEMTDQPRLAT